VAEVLQLLMLTPSNEWWRVTLKPQMRLLPRKRTKNDQVMLFYVTAAGAALSKITGPKKNTD